MIRTRHLICALLLLNGSASFADESADFSAVENTVRKALPGTQINTIQPSPIEGLVEIEAGSNILYADPTGRYLVVGNIYDMHTATDLTAERKSNTPLIDWAELPMNASVKYSANGSQKLAVFFDPDCTWCRKLHEQLKTLDDVEVFAIMYPVEGLHPSARSKAASILCAVDPLNALDKALSGQAIPISADAHCLTKAGEAITQVIEFTQAHNIHGTPTLVSADGRVRPGFMRAQQLKDWLSQANQ